MKLGYRCGAAAFIVFGASASCTEIDPAFYEDGSTAVQTTIASTGTSTTGTSTSTSSGSSESTASDPPPQTCLDTDDAVVFCTDFEEGHLDKWDDYDGNVVVENVLALDGGPRDLGTNHVMRLRIPPGSGGVDLVKLLPGFYDRLHVRWFVKYEPGFDLSRPGLGSGLHAGDRDLLGVSDVRPSGDDRFTVLTSIAPDDPQLVARLDYRGQYQDCDDPLSTCYRDTLPCLRDDATCTNEAHRPTAAPLPLQTGTWYCVEMLVDAGTPVSEANAADGLVELSVDGTEIGRWDDLWLRTDANLKLNVFWLLQYHGGEHGDEGVLYDDIMVSREPIGC